MSDMKPGRELDALIAEKVMGWSDIDWHFDRVYPGRQWMGGNPHGDGDHYVEEVPEFSTDIVAAWEIVEKLAEDGLTAHVEWKGSDREYPQTAEVSFTKGWTRGWVFEDTVPHAICLAALQTKDGGN